MSCKDNIVCMTVQNCKSSFWANSKIDGHGLLKMINNQKSYLSNENCVHHYFCFAVCFVAMNFFQVSISLSFSMLQTVFSFVFFQLSLLNVVLHLKRGKVILMVIVLFSLVIKCRTFL